MRTRRFLLGVLALSALLTFGSGFYATANLASVLAAALALAFLWARANVRWLDVRVTRERRDVQVGDELEETASITNKSKLPVPWVLVEDLGDLPGHRLGRVLGLGAGTSRTWEAITPCQQRGLFTLGPLQVTSGDPLGIFTSRRTLGEAEKVLVYPTTLSLPGFELSTAEHAGESPDLRATSVITPNVAGIRRYASGDSLTRVHWKSSARQGHLMVKEFETERQGGAWVLLDMHQYSQRGVAPENTEEYGVASAASIAAALLAQEQPVGLALVAEEEQLLFPAQGPYQRLRLLETLARARGVGQVPMSGVLTRLEPYLGPSTSLVVISPALTELLTVSAFMVRRGMSGAVVVLDPASFEGEEQGAPLFGHLIATGLAAYLVRRGDSLPRALSMTPSSVGAGRG